MGTDSRKYKSAFWKMQVNGGTSEEWVFQCVLSARSYCDSCLRRVRLCWLVCIHQKDVNEKEIPSISIELIVIVNCLYWFALLMKPHVEKRIIYWLFGSLECNS